MDSNKELKFWINEKLKLPESLIRDGSINESWTTSEIEKKSF